MSQHRNSSSQNLWTAFPYVSKQFSSSSSRYIWTKMTGLQSDIQNHSCKFAFQHQRVYTSTQQLRHGMGSLRHTLQLRIVAGRSHCCLCYHRLSGTYTLWPWDETEPQALWHIVLHSRMFLSARWEIQILFIIILVSIHFLIYYINSLFHYG